MLLFVFLEKHVHEVCSKYAVNNVSTEHIIPTPCKVVWDYWNRKCVSSRLALCNFVPRFSYLFLYFILYNVLLFFASPSSFYSNITSEVVIQLFVFSVRTSYSGKASCALNWIATPITITGSIPVLMDY